MDSAFVILENCNNQIILQKRDNKPDIVQPGMISFFGGSIENGETPLEGAIREIKEELCLILDPKNVNFFGKYPKSNKSENYYVFVSKNIISTGLDLKEGEAIYYLEKSADLEKLNSSNTTKKIISDYLKNENI